MLGVSGYMIYIFLKKNGWSIRKQWKPWSDAAFCGVWSVSALFASYPFRGLQSSIVFFLFFLFVFLDFILKSWNVRKICLLKSLDETSHHKDLLNWGTDNSNKKNQMNMEPQEIAE